MLRRTAILLSLTFLCLVAALTVLAEPLLQGDARLEIIAPSSGQSIRGRVPIVGSVVVPDFQFYKVEWGIGPNPGQWAVIGSTHDQQVTNNQLEVWDTTVVPDNVYTLRLTGVKNDGNWEETYVRNVVVANTAPQATATPSETPTPDGTETPTSVATLEPTLTGEGTAAPPTDSEEPTAVAPGVQIIVPTAGLMPATATPEATDSDAEGLFPFDTASLKDAFVFGGLAMGAVFVMLGIIFGIRRLL
jgi:hypothetical protein